MKWYVALVYNFLSAITAIIGMFIGVAIGNSHEDATAWILSITAGIFFYVALVDLVNTNCVGLSEYNYTKLFLAATIDRDAQKMRRQTISHHIHVLSFNWLLHWVCNIATDCYL